MEGGAVEATQQLSVTLPIDVAEAVEARIKTASTPQPNGTLRSEIWIALFGNGQKIKVEGRIVG